MPVTGVSLAVQILRAKPLVVDLMQLCQSEFVSTCEGRHATTIISMIRTCCSCKASSKVLCRQSVGRQSLKPGSSAKLLYVQRPARLRASKSAANPTAFASRLEVPKLSCPSFWGVAPRAAKEQPNMAMTSEQRWFCGSQHKLSQVQLRGSLVA